MASTSNNLPGTAANLAGPYAHAWSSVNNIKLIDGVNAACSCPNSDEESDWLLATNFGFSIPDGATIVGVRVGFLGTTDYMFDGEPAEQVAYGKLYNSGLIGAERGPVSFNGGESLLGASNNLWGATLTPAIINGANFGVGLKAFIGIADTFPVNFTVDYIRMIVFYSEGGAMASSAGFPTHLWKLRN